MQALRVHDFAAGLCLGDLPEPFPGPGEARVQVRASGGSFFDMLMSRGGCQWRPPRPFVVGSEFAGTIDALGAGVHGGLAVGDRVWGSTSIGAWTQQLCLQALQPVAPQASLDEAAALAQDRRTLGRVLLLP